MKEYTIQEKIAAAKEMVKTFFLERILYAVFASFCFIVLIGLSTFMFLHGELKWQSYLSLFLPTGGIFIASRKVLTMFKLCLDFLKQELK